MKQLILLVTTFCVLCFPGIAAEGKATPPNIIYIIADDLGYGDVRALNPSRGKIKTPNYDRLAAQGMVFTDAHSGSSVCTPTRYGVLTGRYAWRTRLQNGVLDGYVTPLIASNRLTVPALLKQNGYQTAAIGKWHLGFTLEGAAAPATKKAKKAKAKSAGDADSGAGGNVAAIGTRTADGPVTRGFDYFFGVHHARSIKSLFENDRVVEHVEAVDMLPRLARRAADFVTERAKAGGPFFLYLALTSPHTPIVPTKEWQGKSGINAYADFVMETDWAVGEVLAALEKAGIAENTLVIATSDNGCSPAAKLPELHKAGHFPSAQFRGHKADIWDGGHRVPFLVRWPARVKAGSTSTQLICHVDLMATCAEIVGAKIPDNAGEDSVSILPALLGRDTAPLHEAVVHHSISGRFAIRQGNWKLELCPGSGGWGAPNDAAAAKQKLPDVQLYNLRADIGEEHNVRTENPELVAGLTKLLETYVANGRSTPGPKQANDAEIKLIKPNTAAAKE